MSEKEYGSANANNVLDQALLLRVGLWLAQVLLAGVYLSVGALALFLPASQVSTVLPWVGHMSYGLVVFVGIVDLAAGLGLLLPDLTRIGSTFTVIAAICSAMFQSLIVLCHVFGSLGVILPVNLTVIGLSLLVAWGRSNNAPIASRRPEKRNPVMDLFAVGSSDGFASIRRPADRGRRDKPSLPLASTALKAAMERPPVATGKTEFRAGDLFEENSPVSGAGRPQYGVRDFAPGDVVTVPDSLLTDSQDRSDREPGYGPVNRPQFPCHLPRPPRSHGRGLSHCGGSI